MEHAVTDSHAGDIAEQVNAIRSTVTDYSDVEQMDSALGRYLDIAVQYGRGDLL